MPAWAWASNIHPKTGTRTILRTVSAFGTLMLLGLVSSSLIGILAHTWLQYVASGTVPGH